MKQMFRKKQQIKKRNDLFGKTYRAGQDWEEICKELRRKLRIWKANIRKGNKCKKYKEPEWIGILEIIQNNWKGSQIIEVECERSGRERKKLKRNVSWEKFLN